MTKLHNLGDAENYTGSCISNNDQMKRPHLIRIFPPLQSYGGHNISTFQIFHRGEIEIDTGRTVCSHDSPRHCATLTEPDAVADSHSRGISGSVDEPERRRKEPTNPRSGHPPAVAPSPPRRQATAPAANLPDAGAPPPCPSRPRSSWGKEFWRWSSGVGHRLVWWLDSCVSRAPGIVD